MNIVVYASKGVLKLGDGSYPCAIGRDGYIEMAEGREGDGKTPLGVYRLRYGFYRSDRVVLPKCDLVLHATRSDDGWCDGLDDPAYNRPVRLPYPASAEKLFRDSHVYDVIIVLGHNDSPPVSNLGSAIFVHVAREGYKPTEGCVAVSLAHMLEILPKLRPDMDIEISA
ncbi:MAG: hypothetical protein COA69_03255 [Robiginitomaculum sp.]|nr:MAG: hypothetical protein COA69_03255 [Robiginitomaculum sp.]